MGFSTRKKISGFNTSLQSRGLRVQKQIGLGPFRFNVGRYFGGTHDGKITGRSSFGSGGFRWSRERSLGGGKSEFDTDDLNEILDIDTEEVRIPFIFSNVGVMLFSLVTVIISATLFQYFPISIWTIAPMITQVILMILAIYVNPYFRLYSGALSVFIYATFFGWFIISGMVLVMKNFLFG